MKRILFLIVLLSTSIIACTQNLEIYDRIKECENRNKEKEKEITKLSAEKKRLETIISQKKDSKYTIANKEKSNKDSYEQNKQQVEGLETIIKTYNDEITDKTDSINYFTTKNANLEKDKEKYTKDVQDKTVKYNNELAEHEEFNKKLQKELTEAENSGMEEGRKEIITNYWSSKYNGKKFDNLVSMSILECIGYDAKILGKNGEINDLLIYYKAKGCLAQKYDAAKVAQAISDLDNVITRNPLSERAVQLKETLSKYNAVNEAFKNLVKKMDEYNYKTPGETPTIKKKKKANYMNMIANFIKSTDYDYTQYEYISNKLIEVLKIKCSVEGIEKNISYILD